MRKSHGGLFSRVTALQSSLRGQGVGSQSIENSARSVRGLQLVVETSVDNVLP